jgi:hypothetical protein
VKRTFTLKLSTTVRRIFSYRDDTKYESSVGVAFRIDDFADTNDGRIPFSTGEKIQVTWRISTDGKTQIASSVKKTN